MHHVSGLRRVRLAWMQPASVNCGEVSFHSRSEYSRGQSGCGSLR